MNPRGVSFSVPESLWQWSFGEHDGGTHHEIMRLVLLQQVHDIRRTRTLRITFFLLGCGPTAVLGFGLTPWTAAVLVGSMLISLRFLQVNRLALDEYTRRVKRIRKQDPARWDDICQEMERRFGPQPWQAQPGEPIHQVTVQFPSPD